MASDERTGRVGVLRRRRGYWILVALAVVAAAGVWLTAEAQRTQRTDYQVDAAGEAAPSGRSAADETAALVAKQYPRGTRGDLTDRPTNETVLRFVPNPEGSGFVPDYRALAEIERDAQERLSKPGWHPIRPEMYVRPALPQRFEEPVRVASQGYNVGIRAVTVRERSGPLADARGSEASAWVAQDGTLVYAEAFPGCDVAYRASALKTEEFIVIRSGDRAIGSSGERTTNRGAGDREVGSSGERTTNRGAGDREVGSSGEQEARNGRSLVAGDGSPRNTAPTEYPSPGKGVRGVGREGTAAPSGACPSSGPADQGLSPLAIDERASGPVRSSPFMTFSWDLDVPAGLKARLSPAQTIEFVDSQGVPRLRINAPEGKDAAGTKLEIRNSKSEGKGETEELTRGGPRLTLTLDGSRVTLAADVRGLKLPVVIDPTWSSTGSLAKERSYHTATLLGNGKVLVAGSADATLLGSCELYDPSTGTWAATGALSAWRGNFAATLLANGKVLLAGGADADGIDVAPCELYDPSTGTWTPTGALGTTRGGGTATLLANGLVLVAGGYHSSAPVASCELYDPSTGAWTPTGALNTARYDHTATLLGNGKALVAGGYGPIASCELYDPSTGTWAATGALNTARGGQTATLLGNGKVLVVGGWNSGRLSVCEAYDPASGTWSATGSLATVRYGCTTNLLGSGLVLAAGGDDGRTSFSSCELYDLATESWRATVAMAQARSWHTATRLGDGMILVAGGVVVGNGTSYEIATCELFDPTVPEAGATATPMIVATGSPVAFSGQGSDLDGNPMSFSWDFGDGGTANEQNPQHIYVTAGTYIATVTVTGPTGKSAQASVTITASRAPVPRLVTSDVVAFAGNPFQFDASYSTDPENDIASYSWDFGDGSPLGSGQVIAKIYNSPGEYTVTLTVTDSAGVSSTLTRIIQVLPADEIGLFNGFVIYQVRWDRNKTNKDSLSLSASVNVGDTVVGPDMPVALEIAGVRFTGSLDKKLRDYSDKNTKWQVKAGLRKQPFGAVLVKVKIKSASLGAGFNQAGAVVGADPTDTVSVDIPAKIEIGDRSFEVVVPSEFDFNNDGTKAKGNGEF